MAVGKTIALVGVQNGNQSVFWVKLMNGDFRLLLLPETEDGKLQLRQKLQISKPKAEVEVLDCAKSGCWEADVIVFLDPINLEERLLNRIKEVAVQKLVLYVSEEKNSKAEEKFEELQQLLPHSQVLKIEVEPKTEKIIISGGSEEAKEEALEFIKKAGFQVL